jgi:tungstate transport system substrate-binding protein
MSGRLIVVASVAAIAGLAGCGGDEGSASSDRGTMILATTTSTRDSGLLDDLVPDFERDSACPVKTLAVGSGDALKLGELGNADVLLVHSPDAEEEFMRAGHGASRRAVMHNDFVLLGPPADPAGIASAGDSPTALRQIAREGALFVSRGDDSGTHAKELDVWEQAGVRPDEEHYVETGQGMGETLTIASQKRGYTLADRATYLATENLGLEVLVEGDEALLNPYTVIVVREEGTNAACARDFSSWITSPPVQRAISRFGLEQFGEPLFFADVRS